MPECINAPLRSLCSLRLAFLLSQILRMNPQNQDLTIFA